MSNLEVEPKELVCEADPVRGDQVTLLEPRLVPLGGPRAMTVRRTLPQRGRSLIGAWCLAEHYGPDDVAASGGMAVPPHPHPGLQTVSWLFAGEIEHRDSTGAHAMVRPGELNLMTAGSGIQHSEVSVVSTLREPQGSPSSTREHRSTREEDGILHGVQLWTALPDASRHTAPHFEHFVPEVFEHQGANTSERAPAFSSEVFSGTNRPRPHSCQSSARNSTCRQTPRSRSPSTSPSSTAVSRMPGT